MQKLPIVTVRPDRHFSLAEIQLLLRSDEAIAAIRAEEDGDTLATRILTVGAIEIRNVFDLRPTHQLRAEGSKTRGVELYSLAEVEQAYRAAVAFNKR